MNVSFSQVEPSQIDQLAKLANQIWHEFFTIILSEDQINYMVDKFQSAHAIKEQTEHKGYIYYFILEENIPIGFTAIRLENEKLFLSKLYLQKSARGKGYASLAFEFIEKIAKENHKNFIYLTVNKYNEHTIKVYEKKGFVKVDAKVSDIGNGFVMDDFIMEKVLNPSKLTEVQKMIHGYYYMPSDKFLNKKRMQAKELLYDFNLLMPSEVGDQILKQLLGSCGKKPHIEPHFKCDYGKNILIGDYFYANSNCTILDEAKVIIGNEVLFGPNVGLYTVNHPIDAASREKGYEIAKPIVIGNNVWLAANVVVLPGVTIGERSVIAAGSVVTKDIPADCLAAGNPCQIIRETDQEQPISLP